uniref:RNase H type-1 domain-containing protein n=1 Tax=Cannabis sativa TaxID=3483 RepID=A0A803P9X0_CANSA
MVVFLGLQLAEKLKSSPFILQSDCPRVVQYLNGVLKAATNWSALLDGFKSSSLLTDYSSVIHVKKDCNKIAHVLVALALNNVDQTVWLGNIPTCASATMKADWPTPV